MDEQHHKNSTNIGVIADTHGKLSRSAANALANVDLIIHAGDIHSLKVMNLLEQIAPVKAVRGNMDDGSLVHLPTTEVVVVGEVHLYVLHNLEKLDIVPSAAGFDAVIYGHSHRPENKFRQGVLFLNPGSASFPRRGSVPSIAKLYIQGNDLKADLIALERSF